MKFSYAIKASVYYLTMVSLVFQNTLAYAGVTDIQADGSTKTQINQSGNIYDISTSTNYGNVGLNSFNKFDVGNGTTVNLNLTRTQSKLLNLIHDNSPSQINGIVNSYKNGAIGGNVMFANSKGFVVGKEGVFNVGSLTLMTPSKDHMDLFRVADGMPGGLNTRELLVNDLISIELDENRLLKLGSLTELSTTASIQIDGKINAQHGVDIIAGKDVIVNGQIKANLADAFVNTPDNSFTTAINKGNNIIIVAGNDFAATEESLGNVVNISGLVDANAKADKQGRNVLIGAQSQKSHNKAEININSGAVISGNHVNIEAVNTAKKFSKNQVYVSTEDKDNAFIFDDIVEYFSGWIADLDANVTINGGAKISALQDLTVSANVDAVLVSSMYMPFLSINYSRIDSNAKVLVKSGAELNAQNLNLYANTNIDALVGAKSTSLSIISDKNKAGDMAVAFVLQDAKTNTIVEKGAILNIKDNINVVAQTNNKVEVYSQNGIIPILDYNSAGAFSGSIALGIIDTQTKAQFDADVDIDGSLNVLAKTRGQTFARTDAYASGEGESGTIGKYTNTFLKNVLFGTGTGKTKVTSKMYDVMNDVRNRGNAKFSEFKLTAGITVAVVDHITEALIGSDSIKPTIKANNVNLSAHTLDDKSTVTAISQAAKAQTAIAGAVSVHIKDLQTRAIANGSFTLTNKNSAVNALSITSRTEVLHPLSYYQHWDTFVQMLSSFGIYDSEELQKVPDMFKQDIIGADNSLSMPNLDGLEDKFRWAGLDILLKGPANTTNFGLDQLYNTYAQAAAAAKTNKGSTLGLSGAITISLYDSIADATLAKNSRVNLLGADASLNKIYIDSQINNQIWAMSSIFDAFSANEFMQGAGARDGSAAGAGIVLNYATNNTKAAIENDVVITQKAGVAGDIKIAAETNGHFVTTTLGVSNADATGMSGAIGLTLADGDTQAFTGKNSQITARDLNVSAKNDTNYINAITGFSLAENAIALGISGIATFDNIKTYIDGNIFAYGNVTVDAISDKSLINVTNNFSIAKTGTTPPAGVRENNSQDVLGGQNDSMDLSSSIIGEVAAGSGSASVGKLGSFWDKVAAPFKRTKEQLNDFAATDRIDNDWSKAVDADKKTSSFAGSISTNVIVGATESYIAEGAVVQAISDINLNALADILTVAEGGGVSVNGKSSGGAAVVADVTNSDVFAGVQKNAAVDAGKLKIDALQDYISVQAGVGVAVAKQSAGAGTIGSLVQVNTAKAFIAEGARINQKNGGAGEVELNAKNEILLIKGLGALGVQTQPQEGFNSANAVGGVLDVNVLVNKAEAVIEGSADNRAKVAGKIKLNAKNKTDIINADIAGAVAKENSAYAGLLATNVLLNETNAGIRYADIDNSAGVDVLASESFKQVAIAGTAAFAKDTAVGASVRTDILNNAINSFVENSNISSDFVKVNNNNEVNHISIVASAAGSREGTAAVGSMASLISISNQDSHIKDSNIQTLGETSVAARNDLYSTAVTGGLAASSGQAAMGGSLFAVVGQNNLTSSIQNSDVSAAEIKVNSDSISHINAITVGGALSSGGSAYQGAISVLTDIGDTIAFVDGGSLNAPKIGVMANKEAKIVQVSGQVSASTQDKAVGGAVATTVHTNKVKAYIQNAVVSATDKVSVLANSLKNFVSTPVGVSAGKGFTAQGSVDSYVLAHEIDAYIENTQMTSNGAISVRADDLLGITSATGGASISFGGAAVGGSVFTAVLTGHSNAYVRDVVLDAPVKSLDVVANSTEDLDIYGVSGGVSTSGFAATGAVQTIALGRDALALAENVKGSVDSILVQAIGNTDLDHGVGQAAVSLSSVGAGGSVETLVVNKKVSAKVNKSDLLVKDKMLVDAASLFDDKGAVTGISVGINAAVQGAVSTKIFGIDVASAVDSSTIKGTADHKISASNKLDVTNVLATLSASGTAAVGGAVSSIVNNSSATAGINQSDVTGKSVSIDSLVKDIYMVALANAAASGSVAVAGGINTIVVNTQSNSSINGKSINTTEGDVAVKATNNTNIDTGVGQAAGSGAAAIGASISTTSLSKETAATINNAKVNSAGALQVLANSIDDVFSGVVGGAGAGTAAVVGSVNTVVFANQTLAGIHDADLSIGTDTEVLADEKATLGGFAGAAAGAGVAAVGASVFTGVLDNKTQATIKNSIFRTPSVGKLSVVANTIEQIGSKSSPLFNLAGSGAGTTSVNGVVSTFVNTSETKTLLDSVQTISQNNQASADIQSNAATTVYSAAGAAGGAGIASVGATVNTVILNKNVSTVVENSVLGYDIVSAKATNIDKLSTTTVAGGGAGVAAVNGAVATNVVQNTIDATIKNSTLRARDVSVVATQDTTVFAVAGSVSGALVGVGASVLTNVLENKVAAKVDGDIETEQVLVAAKSNENLSNQTISGAGGFVGVAGAVNTNVIGNEVSALMLGKVNVGKTASVQAEDALVFGQQTTGVAAGGMAGVGASVQTNVINNVVQAGTGGTINAGEIKVSAKASEDMTKLLAIGFGVGGVGAAGTTMVNDINTQVLAYSLDNSTIKASDKVSIAADSVTNINLLTTSGAAGAVSGVGAAVVVNSVGKNVQAFTGQNNTLTATKDIRIGASSVNNLGDEKNSMKTIAGAASGGVAIAGSVLVNTISDVVVAKLGNGSSSLSDSLSVDASNKTSLYTDIGMGAGSLLGAGGAMVNVNTVNNTTNAVIGDNASIVANNDFAVKAKTKSTLVNNGYVVSGGAGALSGGVIVSNVGSKQAELSGDTQTNADSAQQQASNALTESQNKINDSKNQIASTKNQVKDQASADIKNAQDNTNKTLSDGLLANVSPAPLPDELQGYNQDTNIGISVGLATSTEMTQKPALPSVKAGMTAAVVGKNTKISAGNVLINAADESDVTATTYGANLGILAAGVSGAAVNVSSTTQAFVDDDAVIKSLNGLKLTAESTDSITVNAKAASGGAVSASGTFALAQSDKTTRAATGNGVSLISLEDALSVLAKSSANVYAYAAGGSFGGLSVGAAISQASANGSTSVGLGQSNTLTAAKVLEVSALSDMQATAYADALAGALIGGTGADARSFAGQTTAVDVGGDTSLYAGATMDAQGNVFANKGSTDNLVISATGKNKSNAIANARSYGVVSAGGAVAVGKINATNRINFADGRGLNPSRIRGLDIKLISGLNNDAYARTLSGAGALIGIGGSKSQTQINANNTVNIGKGYDVFASRFLGLLGNTANTYRSYMDSSAYGLIASSAGIIANDVNSNVFVTTFADKLYSGADMSVLAANATTKNDFGYDLEGGAGGLVGIGSANLTTNIAHDTRTELGGKSVLSKGALNMMAENNVKVIEKVTVDAAGGVPVASGYVKINRDGSAIKAQTKVSNQDVTAQQDALFAAKSNISLYGKSNIITSGVAPVGEGDSFSTASTENSVIFASGSKVQGKRDVFAEALSSMRVSTEVRTESSGLFWDFGSSNVQSTGIIRNWIDSQKDSEVSAYDKLSMTAKHGTSLIGTKSARTTFYLLFGIPITSYEYGNSNEDIAPTTYSALNNIYVNGALRSGDGAERVLNIDTKQDGSVEYSGNIEYSSENVELAVDPNTVEDTKTTLDGSFASENAANNAKVDTAQKSLAAAETAKNANTQTIAQSDENINTATSVSQGYLDLQTVDSATWTAEQAQKIKDSVLSSNLADRAQLAEKISQNPTLTAAEIGQIKKALDQSSDKELANVALYAQEKQKASIALAQNEMDIQKYTYDRDTALSEIKERQIVYDRMMAELKERQADLDKGSLTLKYTDIKDTVVRSGEVVLSGDVSGSGSISAPGNSFSITVNNNTPGTLSFNDLIIDDNVRGKIYINDVDVMGSKLSSNYVGISTGLRRDAAASKVSLNNRVDANDPSFAINRLGNAGDMIFNGLIQNRGGEINVRNMTGNIVSQGTIVGKRISMIVPNGDLKQGFNSSQLDVADYGDGNGIYAAGDIEIMARTINVNGVIQSGVADKRIIIKDFELSPNCDSTSCFQKINGQWVELEKSPNKQNSTWYLLNGNKDTGVDMTNPDNPEQIKAYYDIATGEVILFRAEISGGDITLIGDVVSTGNGQIKLVSGYGHITADNQSGKNLVVSDLNADRKIDGKLTIYDFKSSVDAIGNKALMDSLAQKYADADKGNLENSGFWSDILQYTYKYTAQKEGSQVVVSNDANAGTGESQMVAGADGANFKPTEGSQAEKVEQEDFMQVYIPRSWLIELIYGKEYVQAYMPTQTTKRVSAQNDIKVSFMGYDTAAIDIRSNGAALKVNENISAIDGKVSIASKGDILTDSLNNLATVMAKDIELKANGAIGQQSTLVQDLSLRTDVLGGKLSIGGYDKVSANNAYVALMNGDMDNYDISVENKAHLNVVQGDFLSTNNNQKLTATDVEILAKKGKIQIDNGLFDSTGELIMAAQDDIVVRTQKDINARAIYSEAGDITLASEGSINAISDEDDFVPNVIGKNITLSAQKGSIGQNADRRELKIDAAGKLNATASGDISLRSYGNMYVDKITSGKDVRLIAEAGIINASEDNTYNVQANNLLAVANMGNIENLDVNLDGALSAYAGYRDVNGKWVLTNSQSSIVVNQISKLYTEEEARKLTLADFAGLKDMKIGNVMAQNIFLNSERSIINAGHGSVLNGGRAVLRATAGSVGTIDGFITASLDNMISAYAKDSVYISSPEEDLRVYQIMSIDDKQSGSLSGLGSHLKVASLKSAGSILDANGDVIKDSKGNNTVNESYNVIAQNIILDAQKDVGTSYDDFNILMLGGGLTAKATNLYASSLTDINVQSLNVAGQTVLMARHMDEKMSDIWHNITIKDYQGGNLDTYGKDITIDNAKADTIKLAAKGLLKINSLNARQAFLKTETPYLELAKATIAEYLEARTSDKYLVMDNTSLKPQYDADIQLHAPNKMISLIMDGTQNVNTAFENVVRRSQRITTNNAPGQLGMHETGLVSVYTAMQNNRGQALSKNGFDSLTIELKQGQYHIDGYGFEGEKRDSLDDWLVMGSSEKPNQEVKEPPQNSSERISWFRKMNVKEQHAWLRTFVNR